MYATTRSKVGSWYRFGMGSMSVVALLLTTAWSADADDRKNYPATMCVQQGTTSTVLYDSGGRAVNPSTTSFVSLVCPIVRDETGEKWNSVEVRVVDRNSGNGNVVCQTRRTTSDGSSTIVETRATTGFSNAVQSLTFTTDPISVGGLDTYVLTCSLPPNNGNGASSLLSYSVLEHDGLF